MCSTADEWDKKAGNHLNFQINKPTRVLVNRTTWLVMYYSRRSFEETSPVAPISLIYCAVRIVGNANGCELQLVKCSLITASACLLRSVSALGCCNYWDSRVYSLSIPLSDAAPSVCSTQDYCSRRTNDKLSTQTPMTETMIRCNNSRVLVKF